MITQCAGGIVVRHDQVLLIHQNGNSWSLPKGHCDPGEPMETAARREIAEESGVVALRCIESLGTYQRHRIALGGGDDLSELKEIAMFLYIADSAQLGTIEGHSRPVWVDIDTASVLLTHPKDKAFFDAQRARVQAVMVTPLWIVSTTTDTQETASKIATMLVENELAACVQIEGPIESHYKWHGILESAREWRLSIKCRRDNYAKVESTIRENHTYDLPEIIATEIVGGSIEYLRWGSKANGSR